MPVKHNVVMEITIAWKPRKPSSAPRRGVLLVAVASFHPVSETVPLSDTYRFQKTKMETCIVLYSLTKYCPI